MRIRSFNNKRVEKPPLTVTSSTNSSLVQTRAPWVGRVSILNAWVKNSNLKKMPVMITATIHQTLFSQRLSLEVAPNCVRLVRLVQPSDGSSTSSSHFKLQIRDRVHCSVIRTRHQVSHIIKDHLRLKSNKTERRHPLISWNAQKCIRGAPNWPTEAPNACQAVKGPQLAQMQLLYDCWVK